MTLLRRLTGTTANCPTLWLELRAIKSQVSLLFNKLHSWKKGTVMNFTTPACKDKASSAGFQAHVEMGKQAMRQVLFYIRDLHLQIKKAWP